MAERIPLILDVDTGIDDSLALLYAAASPEADLVAVTCVSGNIDAAQVGVNTRAILELAGRDDVEVAMGRPVPLVRALETTPETHGPQGLGHAELPAPSRPLSDRHAVDVILDEARRRPGEITLVTLGPMTNLAIAVLREPALPRLLRGWVYMGGAFGVSGNTTPTTEWNVHCDPEAAQVVHRAWSAAIAADPTIPRALGLGLNVTERAQIGTDEVVRLARRAGSTPDDSLALARGEDPMLPGPFRGQQPDRPLPGRRAALLLRVPRQVRRLLRRAHPRSAGRGRGARPLARAARRRWPSTSRRPAS